MYLERNGFVVVTKKGLSFLCVNEGVDCRSYDFDDDINEATIFETECEAKENIPTDTECEVLTYEQTIFLTREHNKEMEECNDCCSCKEAEIVMKGECTE